jgi:hypothetical protein
MAHEEAVAQRLRDETAHQRTLTQMFKEAVQQNDEASLRGFMQRYGFAYALNSNWDGPERIVLLATLEGTLSLELMRLFFQELGGRFIVQLEKGYTIWGTLMRAEADLFQNLRGGPTQAINSGDRQYLVRTYQRTAQVVECMVETLGFPLTPFMDHAALHYPFRPADAPRALSVLNEALERFNAYNTLLVLGQRLLTPEAFTHQLSEVWAPRILNSISDNEPFQSEAHDEWMHAVLLPLLTTEAVIRLRANEARLHYMVLCALADEANRRADGSTREMVTRMRFQPRNTEGELVMQTHELFDMIHHYALADNDQFAALKNASRPPPLHLQNRWHDIPAERTHG